MDELNEQKQIRLEKLDRLRAMGINPFPYRFSSSHPIEVIHEESETLLANSTVISIAGRMMAVRGKGKAIFGNIQSNHQRLQIYVRLDEVGETQFEVFELCDIGDHLGVSGTLMLTKTGELTLRVKELQLLSKAIRPLPVPKVKEVDGQKIIYDEVRDKEFRYRQRYADLALNEKVAHVFRQRSLVIQTIRQYLLEHLFLEVETPTLQSIYGGANATPFTTHHNALGINFYLRISNELFLKRLVGGGLDRVFEFVKNFRNEGIDRTHNPEFTALEFYQAYADYTDMMVHCETIWERCALTLHGKTSFEFQGKTLDVRAPWERLSMRKALQEYAGMVFEDLSDEEVQSFLNQHNLMLKGGYSRGLAMQMIFEETCESQIIQPTIITDYPQESSPLCKTHRDNEGTIERFEAYMNGWEIANAYSELNDPVTQKRLLEEQVERGRGGEEETHPYDEDFLRAMEYGMPPMGGIGLGIDRMVMLLTNQTNIRDVILFPTMKPEHK